MSGSTHERDCLRLADGAAYVLRALDESEAEVHRKHLAECPICRADLSELQPIADALAVGVAHGRVPAGVRAPIMTTVHAEVEQLGSATPRARIVAGERPRGRRWLAPALAAALVLGVGLVVGALVLSAGTSESAEVIRAVVVAPGSNATAELHKAGSFVELVVLGMPSPPPGRIYEVWLQRGAGAPEPTDALFSVTGAGSGSVGVPGDLDGVSKVLVTDEPLGGSLQPTRNPVIVGSI